MLEAKLRNVDFNNIEITSRSHRKTENFEKLFYFLLPGTRIIIDTLALQSHIIELEIAQRCLNEVPHRIGNTLYTSRKSNTT